MHTRSLNGGSSKSSRSNRSSGPREKYKRSGTCQPHSLVGLRRLNPTPCHGSTTRSHPLPLELTSGYHEVRMSIPTSCSVVGLFYQLASRQRKLSSGGPAPPHAAVIPQLHTTHRQQKIQILRAVTIPAISSRRVKLSSPLFIHLSRPEIVPLI
jgi:hypothetical protein